MRAASLKGGVSEIAGSSREMGGLRTTGWRTIWHLKNIPQSSHRGLQLNHQRTKCVHIIECASFATSAFLLGRFPIYSTAKEIVKCGAPRGLI